MQYIFKKTNNAKEIHDEQNVNIFDESNLTQRLHSPHPNTSPAQGLWEDPLPSQLPAALTELICHSLEDNETFRSAVFCPQLLPGKHLFYLPNMEVMLSSE